MQNRHAVKQIVAGVLIGAVSLPANAVEFVAKAAIGRKSSELIIRDRSFNPDFTTLDMALTATHGRYFVTVDNEFSIKDDISVFDDDNDAFDGLIFYSRQDLNITVGYIFEQFTAFAGVRSGSTDAFYSAQNIAFGTSSQGFYAGASSSYFVEGIGNFTGSAALASLDGEVTLNEPLVDTSAFTVSTPPANIQGSALGLSIGLGLQGEISASTLYSIEWKLNRFDFEDDVVFGGLDLSYTENFSTFYIGLTHFFE